MLAPGAGVPVMAGLSLRTLLACSALFVLVSACTGPGEPPAADPWLTLVQADRWQPVRVESPYIDEPGKVAECDSSLGALAEVLNLEMVFSVMTGLCPYVSMQQDSLHAVDQGAELRLRFWHSELTAPSDSVANVLVLMDGELLWAEQFEIPSNGQYLDVRLTALRDLAAGVPVVFHVDNHGANEYSFIELSVR